MTDRTYVFRLTGDMAQLDRSAATAGRSVDKLAGQTESFSARLVKATQTSTSFGGSLAAFATGSPVLALGAAAGAVGLFASRVATGIDSLNDLADATGSTVGNLSALIDIGARTGTSQDTVTTSVIKFNNALKEADGKNGVSRALQLIGVDAAALKKEDPAEALRQVAAALSIYRENGNKARVVQELFGKSLREVAPFLNDLAKQTELVGTVTDEQAKAAERFTQQLASMEKSAVDLARTVSGPLISAFNKFFAGIKAYGGLGSFLKDNFRFDQTDDAFGGLARANQEIEKTQARLARIGQFEQRPGLSDALVNRYKAERAELDAQLVTLKQRRAYILGQSADPSGGSTELARRRRGATDIGEIPAAADKPKKSPAVDALEEADRRIREALDRYIERDVAAEERLTAKNADELKKRSEQAQQFGLQLLDQTEVISASLITDERARGEALIEIDRQRVAEQIETFQLGTEEQARLYDLLAQNVAARQAQLTEQLKPQYQRMLEGWADTNRLMRETSEDFQADFLRSSEDTWVQFVKTGKLSFQKLGDLLLETLARYQFQSQVSSYAGVLGSAIAGFFGGGGATNGLGGQNYGGQIVNNPSAYVGGAATGTNFVERDMLTILHKGEAIVPAAYNPAAMGKGFMGAGPAPTVTINMIGAPADTEVKQPRQDANGNLSIDVIFRQFKDRLSAETAAGYGLAPAIQARFGGSGAANLGI